LHAPLDIHRLISCRVGLCDGGRWEGDDVDMTGFEEDADSPEQRQKGGGPAAPMVLSVLELDKGRVQEVAQELLEAFECFDQDHGPDPQPLPQPIRPAAPPTSTTRISSSPSRGTATTQRRPSMDGPGIGGRQGAGAGTQARAEEHGAMHLLSVQGRQLQGVPRAPSAPPRQASIRGTSCPKPCIIHGT
jgi:hypothetical protein